MKYTKGPWFVVAEDGTDFTAIATAPRIKGKIDFDKEVLGGSEWLRVSSADLKLMAAAPRLLEALNKIANEDYRGNRPYSAEIAYRAIQDLK